MGIDTKWLANRIEELIKERDEAWKRAAHAEKMWGETEVKLSESEALLAKALVELERLGFDFQCIVGRELKGQDDE
jgi:hypothetical protein